MQTVCRLCQVAEVKELIDFGEQPIVHFLQQDTTCSKKYPFKVGFCPSCEFVQLIDIIPPEILYENYFTLSGWKNQPHVNRLIDIINGFILDKQSKILEIGCNDGSFLLSLKENGYSNLLGIEPTKDAYEKAIDAHLVVDNSFFNKKLVLDKYQAQSFDMIISRQVLEHITDVNDFMECVSYLLKDSGKLIIEVPDSTLNFGQLDYGLWEEHTNYFTLNTLKKLLNKHQFKIIHDEKTLFCPQAMTLFCEKSSITQVNLKSVKDLEIIQFYQNSWHTFNTQLNVFLQSLQKRVVIYGCGARSSTFVNFNSIHPYIEAFIDDQVEKQNQFLPTNREGIIPIVAWKEKYRDYIILLGVNTENETKVIKKRALDTTCVYSILPPSFLLPKFWKDMSY